MAGIIECEQIGELSHEQHIDDDDGENENEDEDDEEDFGDANHDGVYGNVDDSDVVSM